MEFLYTDRSEQTIEALLIWWSKLPCYPVMSSHFLDDNYEGNYENVLPYTLTSTTTAFKQSEGIPVYFQHKDDENSVLLEPGDRLVYDHDSLTMTLVRDEA